MFLTISSLLLNYNHEFPKEQIKSFILIKIFLKIGILYKLHMDDHYIQLDLNDGFRLIFVIVLVSKTTIKLRLL